MSLLPIHLQINPQISLNNLVQSQIIHYDTLIKTGLVKYALGEISYFNRLKQQMIHVLLVVSIRCFSFLFVCFRTVEYVPTRSLHL